MGRGKLEAATVEDIHSWRLQAPSDAGLRELESVGGVWWQSLVSLPSLPTADSWVVWTYVNTAPHASLGPPPVALKSPVASPLPDVASRCGLEQVRQIRDAEAATKSLALPSPAFSSGACSVRSLPCLPFTSGSVYQGPRGTRVDG